MSQNINPIPIYIGIAAAICMAASDVILLGVPQAGWEGDIASFSSLPYVSLSRISAGSLLGWISSFFICFGFWYIRDQLSGSRPRIAMIMFACMSAYIVFGGAFHAGYYFAGVAIHQGETASYFRFVQRLVMMSYFSGAFLMTGVLFYIYILWHDHHFPRWLMFTNMLVLQGVFLGIGLVLPAPLGGFIKPMFINLAAIAFFSIHLAIGLKYKNPETAPGIL